MIYLAHVACWAIVFSAMESFRCLRLNKPFTVSVFSLLVISSFYAVFTRLIHTVFF